MTRRPQASASTPTPVKLHRHLIGEILLVLRQIMAEGVHADKAIERAFKSHRQWGARDRRLFAETVYDIVRWWRHLWHLASLPPEEYLDPDAMEEEALWRVWSVYWLDKGESLPFWEECRYIHKNKKAASAIVAASLPDWIYERGKKELGKDWPALVGALNRTAEVFLRANTLKVSTRDLQIKLGAEDISTQPVPGIPDAVRLLQRRNVFPTAAFKQGFFEVQDASSQRIAPFLEVQPGMRVIDACAGAGGKTLHLASLMQNKGRVLAMDVHEWKLKELRRRATRNGADTIETKVVEGPQTLKRLHASADRVLLDVPCSGLGVLRRNPDAKWKLSPEELDRLVTLQAEILQNYSRLVKPGGKLVYATCSILPSENERQVKAFLKNNPKDWKLEAELHLRPDREGFDGFYAARLLRLPNSEAPAAPKAKPKPNPKSKDKDKS